MVKEVKKMGSVTFTDDYFLGKLDKFMEDMEYIKLEEDDNELKMG